MGEILKLVPPVGVQFVRIDHRRWPLAPPNIFPTFFLLNSKAVVLQEKGGSQMLALPQDSPVYPFPTSVLRCHPYTLHKVQPFPV